MQRRTQKKPHHSWIIPLIVLIIVLVAGIVAYKFFTKPHISTASKTTTSLQADSPTKTNKSNGYVSEKAVKSASGSMPVASDAGNPQWIKVPAKKKLQRFTNLSKGDLTIYRINNPEVLKTATSTSTAPTYIADIAAKYPNSLIINATGFKVSTGSVVGLQINNGQLFEDWPITTKIRYSFVINKNGSCKIYDSSTPASTIIQNGAEQSYDFGVALIRDGKIVPSDGSVNWETHSFIGNDKDNNLYAIVSATNAGYQNIIDGVSSLHLENLLQLDGGGSTQLSLKGKTIVPSEYNRKVPDYIVMK
ncbi:phosphodiester glycosidase family protein [Lactococcus nasutitermitis]|uniref:Phosphodiester glycosidase family protein n=1 Tax=Lactococcus nasutitermitis TaxID=1652957 RepID=A0ABV9JCH9_9LACT|nr:phosphodiester glycosidase family protein [Lactococcus nasutitermitis]